MDLGVNEHLNRVILGIGWPGEKAGCVVVLAEKVKIEYPKRLVSYHVVDQAEASDLTSLLEATQAFRNDYGPEAIFARSSHHAAKEFLTSWGSHGRPIYVTDPPHVHMTGYIEPHLNILAGCLRPGRKLLFGIKNTRVVDQLALVPLDTSKVTDLMYPSVAALGYGVTALVELQSFAEAQRDADLLNREAEEIASLD
jgi:hypothetical protein